MEEFKEKARVLTCKEFKYPAKCADPWPEEWTAPAGCAKNMWKPKSCLYFYVTGSLSDYHVSLFGLSQTHILQHIQIWEAWDSSQ